MSSSYPLMDLARRLGVDYGVVLAYADDRLWLPTLTRQECLPGAGGVVAVVRPPSDFGAAPVWRAAAYAELQARGLLLAVDLELSLLMEQGLISHATRRVGAQQRRAAG